MYKNTGVLLIVFVGLALSGCEQTSSREETLTVRTIPDTGRVEAGEDLDEKTGRVFATQSDTGNWQEVKVTGAVPVVQASGTRHLRINYRKNTSAPDIYVYYSINDGAWTASRLGEDRKIFVPASAGDGPLKISFNLQDRVSNPARTTPIYTDFFYFKSGAGLPENRLEFTRTEELTSITPSALAGSNFSDWNGVHVDADRAYFDKLGATLNQAKIRNLRFPGGEVSDAYDWRYWEDPYMAQGRTEPFDTNVVKTNGQKTVRLPSTTEFCYTLKKAQGAGLKISATFVISVEQALKNTNPAQGFACTYAEGDPLSCIKTKNQEITTQIAETLEWLERAQTLGCTPDFIEMSNESYLPSGRPLIAREMAELTNRFSSAIKTRFPNVQIGVNGPSVRNHVVFWDRLNAEDRIHFFTNLSAIIKTKETLREYVDEITSSGRLKSIANCDKWWETINQFASYDFMVLHEYHERPSTNIAEPSPSKTINFIREASYNKPFAITEWNAGFNKAWINPEIVDMMKNSEISHLLSATEYFIQYASSGALFVNYWPLYWPGWRGLIDSDPSNFENPFQANFVSELHRLLFEQLGNRVLKSGLVNNDPEMNVMVSSFHNTAGAKVVLVNRGASFKRIRIPHQVLQQIKSIRTFIEGPDLRAANATSNIYCSSVCDSLVLPPKSATFVSTDWDAGRFLFEGVQSGVTRNFTELNETLATQPRPLVLLWSGTRNKPSVSITLCQHAQYPGDFFLNRGLSCGTHHRVNFLGYLNLERESNDVAIYRCTKFFGTTVGHTVATDGHCPAGYRQEHVLGYGRAPATGDVNNLYPTWIFGQFTQF